jgi:hypothetical protein
VPEYLAEAQRALQELSPGGAAAAGALSDGGAAACGLAPPALAGTAALPAGAEAQRRLREYAQRAAPLPQALAAVADAGAAPQPFAATLPPDAGALVPRAAAPPSSTLLVVGGGALARSAGRLYAPHSTDCSCSPCAQRSPRHARCWQLTRARSKITPRRR